jgi:hypothetical protein
MQATTAAVAVEAAQRLLIQPLARYGVLAPAEAFDPKDFLNALAPHGVTWSIEPGWSEQLNKAHNSVRAIGERGNSLR